MVRLCHSYDFKISSGSPQSTGQRLAIRITNSLLLISFPTMCLLTNFQEPQAPSQLLKQWSSDLHGWYTLLLLLHEVSSCLPISQPPQAELVTGFQGCLCVRLCCDMYHTVSFIYTWLSLPSHGWNLIRGASQGHNSTQMCFFLVQGLWSILTWIWSVSSYPFETMKTLKNILSFSAITTGRYTRKKVSSIWKFRKQYFVKGFSVIIQSHSNLPFLAPLQVPWGLIYFSPASQPCPSRFSPILVFMCASPSFLWAFFFF